MVGRNSTALRAAALLVVLASVAGCATPPTDPAARAEFDQTNDRFEPLNRRVFALNLVLDEHIGTPVAKAYRRGVHPFFRTGIRNFLDHIQSPVTFINDVLQGERERAAETATRFWVNTIVGFGGFFDVAGQYGLRRHKEDFGQTLAVWGAPEGPYIMLPLLGPSNARDLTGRIVDNFSNPISYALSHGGVAWLETIAGVVDAVDTRERSLDQVEELKRTSIDFYASVRSLYRQNREAEILNGKVTKIPLPGEDE